MAPDSSAPPAPIPLSLEAYRLLFESNPDPILLYDTATWRILAVNDAASALYGWSTTELESMSVLDIRPAAERERFREVVPTIPDAVTRLAPVVQQTRDGRLLTVHVTTAGIRLDDGRHARLTVVKDVTAESELRDLRDRLAAIVAGSHDAIFIVDREGRLGAWNPGAERMFGYREADVLGGPLTLIHPSMGGTELRGLIDQVAGGGVVRLFDTQARTKDGRDFIVSMTLSPVTGADGRLIGISGIERDVSERRHAERALRESEARFARIFQSDLILTAAIDVQGRRFKDVNETWLRFFSGTREEFVGAPLDTFSSRWLDQEQRTSLMGMWQAGGRIKGVEVGFNTRSGPRYALLSGHHSADPGENIVIMVDITERRRLEEQLSEARRLEALGRLAGGVAHDFNNMLSVMSGYAELIEEQLPPASPALADLQEIKRAADRATELTRQLLAFGRRQMLQPRRVDLNEVVRHADTFLRRVLGEHVTLQLSLAAEPLWVDADAPQLEQVLVNLASNARDALDGAGVVQIKTGARTLPAAWAEERGLPAGRTAELAVRDTGRGMDPDTLQRIFEPFFTTKEVGQGTGLGLATVYGIVKQSGGHVEAASTPGQGSLFRVTLPLLTKPDPVPSLADEDPSQGGTETLLLVEDEAAVAKIVASQLQRLGYRLLTAHSAAEAIVVASAYGGPIDLMVSDVVMPGASGRDLMDSLRAVRPGMKVLYMSGYPADDVVRHGVEEGKTPFLQKPFTFAALACKVRETLGHPS